VADLKPSSEGPGSRASSTAIWSSGRCGAFLGGIGLDLRTAAGTDVRVDDSLHPKKLPRAFAEPVNAPEDVRMS